MAGKSPIFPMPEPQHYSDYGFDPQIDYFQVLREARKQSKREARRMDSFRFKLQKPISKDDPRRGAKGKKRGRWWRNALLFWKRKGTDHGGGNPAPRRVTAAAVLEPSGCASYPYFSYAYPEKTVSSPLYMTESNGAGSWTPGRSSGGGCGGWGVHGLASLRLTQAGEVKMPYLCLSDLAAMEASPSPSAAACPSPAPPIYLVT